MSNIETRGRALGLIRTAMMIRLHPYPQFEAPDIRWLTLLTLTIQSPKQIGGSATEDGRVDEKWIPCGTGR